VAVVRVVLQEVVLLVVVMVKERHSFQVVKAVTLDHNRIQVREVAVAEPQQYS
jgi:hypothetical protein